MIHQRVGAKDNENQPEVVIIHKKGYQCRSNWYTDEWLFRIRVMDYNSDDSEFMIKVEELEKSTFKMLYKMGGINTEEIKDLRSRKTKAYHAMSCYCADQTLELTEAFKELLCDRKFRDDVVIFLLDYVNFDRKFPVHDVNFKVTFEFECGLKVNTTLISKINTSIDIYEYTMEESTK